MQYVDYVIWTSAALLGISMLCDGTVRDVAFFGRAVCQRVWKLLQRPELSRSAPRERLLDKPAR